MNRPELNANKSLFYILLLSTVFLNLSFSSHYVIIGAEKEKLIFKATLYACLLNVIINLVLIPIIGIYGSALALLGSTIVLLIFKKRYEKQCLSGW